MCATRDVTSDMLTCCDSNEPQIVPNRPGGRTRRPVSGGFLRSRGFEPPMRRGTLCATPWAVWDDSGRYEHLQERIYTLNYLDISRYDLGLDDTISSDLMY